MKWTVVPFHFQGFHYSETPSLKHCISFHFIPVISEISNARDCFQTAAGKHLRRYHMIPPYFLESIKILSIIQHTVHMLWHARSQVLKKVYSEQLDGSSVWRCQPGESVKDPGLKQTGLQMVWFITKFTEPVKVPNLQNTAKIYLSDLRGQEVGHDFAYWSSVWLKCF